jgi:uncharacterized protein with beta-barrel porin domain
MAARVQGATLAVTGYKELVRGLKQADPATRREVRTVLRTVGDKVKTDAAGRFARYDARTAAGYRTYVRQRGVSVQQSLRKTTGRHPEFGALQMRRALVPALDENKDDTARRLTVALDRVCARVG